jgi:hypothetical protein
MAEPDVRYCAEPDHVMSPARVGSVERFQRLSTRKENSPESRPTSRSASPALQELLPLALPALAVRFTPAVRDARGEYKAFHHHVDGRTIGKARRRATAPNNTYVVYKEGLGYRITPSGIAYVESKIRTKAGSAPAVEQPELTAQQPEPAES